eukprot:jgi/Mesvir1/19668/Mv09944-RA.1
MAQVADEFAQMRVNDDQYDNYGDDNGDAGTPLSPPYGGVRSEAGRTGTYSPSSTKFLAAQRARKAVDEDAQRLANRVAQLKKEEDKSLKRIAETKRRAEEIMALRQRNEEAARAKQQMEAERQEELQRQMELLQAEKDEHMRRKRQVAEQLYVEKRTEMRKTKEERAEIEKRVREQRLAEQQKAIASKEAVKKGHMEGREKVLNEKHKTIDKVRQEVEKRVEEERAEQKAKERELARLAREEMELIQRLQQKQQEQRKAYEELEQALGIVKKSRPSSRTTSSRAGSAQPRQPMAQSQPAPRSMSQQPAAQPQHAPPPQQQQQQHQQQQHQYYQPPPQQTYQPVTQAQAPGTPPPTIDDDDVIDEEEAEISAKFSEYDPKGVGVIDTSNLGALFRDLGESLDEEQVEQAALQLDPSGSGKVHYGDFLMWWRG